MITPAKCLEDLDGLGLSQEAREMQKAFLIFKTTTIRPYIIGEGKRFRQIVIRKYGGWNDRK
jgi:hypothetical protein